MNWNFSPQPTSKGVLKNKNWLLLNIIGIKRELNPNDDDKKGASLLQFS